MYLSNVSLIISMAALAALHFTIWLLTLDLVAGTIWNITIPTLCEIYDGCDIEWTTDQLASTALVSVLTTQITEAHLCGL